ncbi:unnamed protein product [Rotaria magnacalcarata]|nr:unnamed protein product [Rotaria magnacalcarata]CAF4538485.1 unnamed protein product [Rotaria magnacalcarata]
MNDNVQAFSVYQQSLANQDKIVSSDCLDAVQTYKAIEQVFEHQDQSLKTSSFVKPVIKNIRIPQVPKQFRIKNFRMKLILKGTKK